MRARVAKSRRHHKIGVFQSAFGPIHCGKIVVCVAGATAASIETDGTERTINTNKIQQSTEAG